MVGFLFTILYELPIRRYLNMRYSDLSVSAEFSAQVRRRLLNEPFVLIGMDFGNIIGKYSKPHFQGNIAGSSTKIKKLKYAFDLLDWISKKIESEIILINSETKSNY